MSNTITLNRESGRAQSARALDAESYTHLTLTTISTV